MFVQAAVLASVLVIVHSGLLLGGGYEGGYGGGYGGYGGGSSIGKEAVIDLVSPPKYEFKYAVADGHTGDQKEQVESRVHDLTKSEYALAEKDRKIQVSRIIHGSVPVKIVGKY